MATRSVPQPPFSPELLADLHAGNLAPELHEQLWPAVRRDGEALRFVHALDEVSSELRALGRSDRVIHRMPEDVTARLTAFLDGLDSDDTPEDADATIYHLPVAGENHDGATVSDGAAPTDDAVRCSGAARLDDAAESNDSTRPDDAARSDGGDQLDGPARPDGPAGFYDAVRPGDVAVAAGAVPEPAVPAATPVSLDERRRSRLRWLTAAAAAVAVVACASIALTVVRGNDTPPVAQPTSEGAELDEPTAATMLTALGRNDASGLLSNPAARERCVRANDLERTVLGSMNIRYHGKDAVLLLLTGPRTPKITALIVGTGCSTDDPQRLTVQDIG